MSEGGLGLALYDIAHALECADGSQARVLHALSLLRKIVPYDQCSLLHVQPGVAPHLVTVPVASPSESEELTRKLMSLFGLLAGQLTQDRAPRPSTGRLAVPLIGLDEVIGVIEVHSGSDQYSVEHLRALSVVAAQLAAHLTMLQARLVAANRGRELDDARRAAEAANRAKDEFLALISHELKTPLNSTLAWAQTLGSENLNASARADAVAGIERGVRAQSKLIDDILDLAGIATASLQLDLRAIEPARRIKAAIEGLRLRAEERAIRLETALDPKVTPLFVDPDRFDQIVSNLVANAVASTPNGGRVEVRLERTNDHARIRVTDTGTGIAPEILPRVFQNFRAPPSATDPSERVLDVGLAIVKNLVELHGGTIAVESGSEHPGTTFTVELPIAFDAGLLAGLRVLLVDDDEEFRDALRTILEDRGALVTAVGSVGAALAALEHQKPDVLLSELGLPGASGYDLIREVSALNLALPAGALTKFGGPKESARAVAAGFRVHLAKPMDIDALVAAVADLAGRQRPITRPGIRSS